MVCWKCSSAVERKSDRILIFIQGAWPGEWRKWWNIIFTQRIPWVSSEPVGRSVRNDVFTSNFRGFKFESTVIEAIIFSKVYHWSDFCDKLNDYGTGAFPFSGASNGLCSTNPIMDDIEQSLAKIHSDLMFEHDDEEICIEVYRDEFGKETHHIIDC